MYTLLHILSFFIFIWLYVNKYTQIHVKEVQELAYINTGT